MALEDGNCRSLGSRLRALEDQTIDSLLNDALAFEVADWLLEGSYYVLDLPTDLHSSGALPIFQTYEKRGSEYHCVQLEGIILKDTGDLKVRVLAEPDLRFAGRFIFDE